VTKVNWDVVIDKARQMMAMGIIVRDQEGNVLASTCSLKQFIVDHVLPETYAGWKAVEFSRDMGMLT
jgi:hypothetical protein